MTKQTIVWTECQTHYNSSKYWIEFWQSLALLTVLFLLLVIEPVNNDEAIIGVAMFLFAKLLYPLGKMSKNKKIQTLSWIIGATGIAFFLNTVCTDYNPGIFETTHESLLHRLFQQYLGN